MAREWDVERLIKPQAPLMTLLGLLAAAKFSRKWLILPFLFQTLVLVHAVQGFYP